MPQTLIETSKLRTNPNNPRAIREDQLDKLVKSLREFPEMLEARPIVTNPDLVVLGGNMRLKAALLAGLEKVPVYVATWEEAKNKEFVIKDNVAFGEWDWDMLANEWDAELLTEWGMDVWLPEEEPDLDDLIADEKEKPATMRITFDKVEHLQEAENEIQELIDRKWPGAFFSVSAGEV
jgi:hypothetical protein